MGIIFLAMLQVAAGMDTAKATYEQCVTSEAVRLGSGNQESADTILRAVRFKCEPAWRQLQLTFPTAAGIPIAERARSSALAKWRNDAEGAAITALLEARSR